MEKVLDKSDKKDLILDVAEKLFSELGFDGASTRHIAKDAGINMAMLNYYFGSKDGLYKSVLERRLGGFRQTLSNLNHENISSWDKINKCVELYVDRVMGNECFHRLINREMSLQQRSETTDFIAESMMRNVNEVKRIIEEGVNNGTFREVDIEMTVASIMGTKHFVVNSTLLSSKLMNKDLSDASIIKSEMKPRVIAHLKELLKSHLTKKTK
ncbi:MAG: TetR/AcrR family transcriptional regulator [Daejeonella sp.]